MKTVVVLLEDAKRRVGETLVEVDLRGSSDKVREAVKTYLEATQRLRQALEAFRYLVRVLGDLKGQPLASLPERKDRRGDE